MFLILTFLIVLVAYFVTYIKKRQHFWADKGVKYVTPRFLLGNVELFRTKHVSTLSKELYEQFPDERYYGIFQFLQPTILVRDPDLIKTITIKEFDHFVDHKNFISGVKDPFWTKNLFASEGDKWRDMRATLSPAFTGSKMKNMFGLMEECSKQFIDYFSKKCAETSVLELDLKDAFSRYANDVIATTAFGLKIDSLHEKNNEFYLMGKEAINVDIWKFITVGMSFISPNLSKFFNFKMVPTKVANYFVNIIGKTLKMREEHNIVRPDMIHLLTEARKSRESSSQSQGKFEISTEDIAAQAFLFFFAGFDTISSALSFTFYELALNPAIQDRLRKDLLEAPEAITYESLSSIKYLEMVISESLRKWPPASLTNRKVTKPFTIKPVLPHEKPLYLDKGQSCWLPIYALHRDPKYYADPETFDPERFNEENKSKIVPSAYLPFGAGPRNCIGSRFALMEMKLIIYYILRNFEVVTSSKTDIPIVIDPRQINITARNGMWLGLKKLSK